VPYTIKHFTKIIINIFKNMEYRRLGKSGLQVSVLSLGSWLTFGKQIGDDVAEDLMKIAYEQGVNFFDNAEIYARGKAETVMGKAFKKMKWSRDSYVVSSKVYFGTGGALPNQTGLSRKHIVEGCEASLKRMQMTYFDVYFCHRPDKNVPMEEIVWSMNLLIQQGKILYWGTSEWSAQEIMEAHMVAKELRLIPPITEQPQYNMFERQKVEVEYSQIYKTVGLGNTIWSPLASGVLSDKYINQFPTGTRLGIKGLEWLKDAALTEEKLEKTRQLNQLAKDLDTTLPKLAIAWCVQNPNVSTVILGASKPQHLTETLSSLSLVSLLTPTINAKIEDVLQNKPKMPQF
jgi:voltage-dependent potassium channel beta subunit